MIGLIENLVFRILIGIHGSHSCDPMEPICAIIYLYFFKLSSFDSCAYLVFGLWESEANDDSILLLQVPSEIFNWCKVQIASWGFVLFISKILFLQNLQFHQMNFWRVIVESKLGLRSSFMLIWQFFSLKIIFGVVTIHLYILAQLLQF